jgi:hypothetical protein
MIDPQTALHMVLEKPAELVRAKLDFQNMAVFQVEINGLEKVRVQVENRVVIDVKLAGKVRHAIKIARNRPLIFISKITVLFAFKRYSKISLM